MGQAPSKTVTREEGGLATIDCAEEYSRWTAEAVARAVQRWRDTASGRHAVPPVAINRRQFYEIFTDPSAVVEGGILAVPLDHFDVFARDATGMAPDGTGSAKRVFVQEVLFCVLLFSKSEKGLADKLPVAYELFCPVGEEGIDSAGMVMLLQTVAQASFHIGLLSRMPSQAELERMAGEAFNLADADSDSYVRLDEWVSWGRRAMETEELMAPYLAHARRARRRRSAAKKAAAAAHAKEAAAKAAGKRRPVGVGRLFTGVVGAQRISSTAKPSISTPMAGTGTPKSVIETERGATVITAGVQSPKRRRRKSKSTPHAAPASPPSPSDDGDALDGDVVDRWRGTLRSDGAASPSVKDARTPKAEFSVAEFDQRVRAVRLRSVANHRTLHALEQATHLSLDELKLLAKEYNDHIIGHAGTGLTPEGFKKLLSKHLPALASHGDIADRALALADRDGSGSIDFAEFASTFSLALRGPLEDKVRFLFDVLDTDGSGNVAVAELAAIVRHSGRETHHLLDYAEEVLQAFDADGDGEVDADEFVSAIERDSALLDAFYSAIRISRETATLLHAARRVDSCSEYFTFEKVLESEKRLVGAARRALFMPLSLDGFVKLVEETFGLSTERHVQLLTLLPRAFEAMQLSHVSQSVTTRDALNALGQVLSSEVRDQLRLYFRLFDQDGNGLLDSNEILLISLASKASVSEAAGAIVDLLRTLDTDGDGTVSPEEFMKSAFRSPLVVNSLRTLFAISSTSSFAATGSIAPARARADSGRGSFDVETPTEKQRRLKERRRRRLSAHTTKIDGTRRSTASNHAKFQRRRRSSLAALTPVSAATAAAAAAAAGRRASTPPAGKSKVATANRLASLVAPL